MRVVFAHLDLGIGGAEQLVVNAALALLKKGHDVTIFTTHHSEGHCFAQTRGSGPLASRIIIAGDWLPRSILGKGVAFCSSVRMAYLALVMVMRWRVEECCFCDGVSTQIPILRLRFPVLFYCHFPDLLLCTQRGSFLKRLYRFPLDWLESTTTGLANVIVVNSNFTGGVYRKAFPRLKEPRVVYPAADFESFTPPDWKRKAQSNRGPFVSLNRFERKKDVGLAIEAFALVLEANPCGSQGLRLVIAGGYDESVTENVEYLTELKELASRKGLIDRVDFRPSVDDAERNLLLQSALCVVYTPENEHFGIVPIEAMYAGAPVLASASGGPLETVVDGRTGYLKAHVPAAFAEAMSLLAGDPSLGLEMGKQAHRHVTEKFGPGAFEDQMNDAVARTVAEPRALHPLLALAATVALAALALSLVGWDSA